jgi:HSP20 family protein
MAGLRGSEYRPRTDGSQVTTTPVDSAKTMITFRSETSNRGDKVMLVHWTPFNDLARIQAQLDRVFVDKQPVEEVFRPAVDIVEDASSITITADLPGVAQDAVDLQVDKNVLIVKGARKLERKAPENGADHYRRYERTAGAFERSFRLPPTVDVEKVEASMKDGVLTLTLPKKAEAQPRTIKIKS